MILFVLFNFLFLQVNNVLIKYKEVSGFESGISIASDVKENIYVLDNINNEVLKYDKNLVLKKRSGKTGWRPGEFDNPTFIDASSGLDLIVTDGENNRIQRLDLELNPISVLKTDMETFLENLKVVTPYSATIVNSSDLYVVDKENSRIVVFQDGLKPIYSFGEASYERDKLILPTKILRNSLNHIYVLDKGNNAIFIYESFGNFLTKIEVDSVKSFTLTDKYLYTLRRNDILIYSANSNSFLERKMLNNSDENLNFNDIIVINDRFYLLEKNKLSIWK